MSNMFYNCSSLKSLDVSSFRTENVIGMGGMFEKCSGLTSLDVSKFDTSNVQFMNHMFQGCSGLTSLDLSHFNTSNVSEMGDLFSFCNSLTSIDVSMLDISNLWSANFLFEFANCQGLTQIKVPAALPKTLTFPRNENYIWKNSQGKVCTEIEKLDMAMTYTRYEKTTAGPNDADNNDPNKNNQNSTEQGGGNPAAKGTVLTIGASQAQYKVTSSDVKNPTVEYKGLTNAGKKKKTITIPTYVTYNGVKYKVTSIAAKCFKNNKKLTTVKISNGVTKIGTSAFEGCTNLKTVTIGTGLQTIGKNAFKNCKKLQNLTIKSKKLKSVGKTALKGINTKCKIKVPSSKAKSYKRVFKSKGQKSTVKIAKL